MIEMRDVQLKIVFGSKGLQHMQQTHRIRAAGDADDDRGVTLDQIVFGAGSADGCKDFHEWIIMTR